MRKICSTQKKLNTEAMMKQHNKAKDLNVAQIFKNYL